MTRGEHTRCEHDQSLERFADRDGEETEKEPKKLHCTHAGLLWHLVALTAASWGLVLLAACSTECVGMIAEINRDRS